MVGELAADDRYAVLAVNEVCLDQNLTHEERVNSIRKAGWSAATIDEYKNIIFASAIIEALAPELSEEINDNLRSHQRLDHLWRNGQLVSATAEIWDRQVAFIASNGARLILTETTVGPYLCIFLSPEPRSLIFGRFGIQGMARSSDGVNIFRGELFEDGSLIEYRELNKRVANHLPEKFRFRFLALVLLNQLNEVPS